MGNNAQSLFTLMVDDNLASHMDEDVLTNLIKQIEEHTGK